MRWVLLATLVASSCAPTQSQVAALRVHGDKSTFMVRVTEDRSIGYRLTNDCVQHCSKQIQYAEAIGDSPLGFFTRDRNDLLFSVWSGGSAYRVRVWSMKDDEVRKIAELSSRSRPEFLSAPNGASIIQVNEADNNVVPPQLTRWVWANDRFVRSGLVGR